MDYLTERTSLIETARAMNSSGLNSGKSGNLSQRVSEGFLVTPTGMPYEKLEPADLVILDLDGNIVDGHRRPTSEWHFHSAILKARPEINVVLHTHSTFSTVLACQRLEIPPFHYMISAAGGKNVRVADYATFGTDKLADNAVKALEGRLACLLANHGLIVLGKTLEQTLDRAIEVEGLAEQYWRVLQIGTPVLLDDAEMDRILDKFKTYGQQNIKSGSDGP